MSLNTARSERAVKSIRSPLICMRSSPVDAQKGAEGGKREGDRGFVLFLPPFLPRVATSTPNCGRSRNALGNCRNCLGTRRRTDSSGSTPRWKGTRAGREGREGGDLAYRAKLGKLDLIAIPYTITLWSRALALLDRTMETRTCRIAAWNISHLEIRVNSYLHIYPRCIIRRVYISLKDHRESYSSPSVMHDRH